MYVIILTKENEAEENLYYNISTDGYSRYIEFATKFKKKGMANIIKDVLNFSCLGHVEVIKID